MCGCNVLDTDSNANGQADCLDPNSNTTPSAANYDVSKIGLNGKGTLTILRIRMQPFGGKVVYSYSLTKKGYGLQRSSSTNSIALRGIKLGTYTFSRVVKKGSVLGILRVSTKRGGDDEKTADVSAEIR